MLEAHRFTERFEFGEFAGMHVADDGKMLARRLEILAERENVRALRDEIAHRGENFFFFFAET